MGRAEKEGRCKKHPTHKNSNGVCPYCLRDKLANISVSSSSSSNNIISVSSTSSTAYSSYDSDVSSSSVASPPKQYEERSSKKTIFMLLKQRKQRTLLKSSVSFTLAEKVVEKGKEEKRKSEKGEGKLWAKLFMGKKNQREGRSTLVHSMTVKESSSSSSKWTFFS